MTQTINLNEGTLKDILQRIYALEHASPLNNAAIGRSGLLVYDGGVITIENGGLDVTGTATVSGTLTGSGELEWTGTAVFDGPVKTTGTLDVEGITTLKADLNVTGSGKIKAGVTQISPDGTIAFGPDLQVTPDNGAGQAAIMAGASQIVLTPSNPTYWAQFTGGAYFQGLITGMALKLNSLPTTTEAPNLNIASDGTVRRSTAV